MKTKNIITCLVLILIIVGCIYMTFIYINTNNNEKIVYKEKKIYVKKSEEELIKNENIVIFGDSITERYPVDDIYGDLPVLNSGVSGFKTQDLLDRMDSMLYKYNPSKVILLIGINDLMPDKSENNQNYVVNNIKKIISLINEERPMAKIYLESIYPVNEDKWDGAKGEDNETIIEVNKKLREYAKENKIVFINMYDELTDKNGNLKAIYTNDGLHPNTMGYAKITRVLLPYIYD